MSALRTLTIAMLTPSATTRLEHSSVFVHSATRGMVLLHAHVSMILETFMWYVSLQNQAHITCSGTEIIRPIELKS